MRIHRRGIQLALAGFWLLDGALQLQPFMFTRGFATHVLEPVAVGQPSFVAALVRLGATVVLWHPAVFDSLIAVSQLALGAGLLWRRTARFALGASALWALGVWITGEGLGGVLSGAGLRAGAPGAALLYAVLAVVAWPRGTAADSPPSPWTVPIWSLLWVGLAAAAFARSGFDLLGVAELGVAVLALPRRRGARWLAAGGGAALALFAWTTAQAFGGLATGQATDPNTGPLLVLVAVALVGTLGRRQSGAVLAQPAYPDLRLVDASLDRAAA